MLLPPKPQEYYSSTTLFIQPDALPLFPLLCGVRHGGAGAKECSVGVVVVAGNAEGL